jgi:uncharacterized coiled-coil protein SlyX
MSLEQYIDDKGNFQLPLEKVLEKLSQQCTQQSIQIASLQTALDLVTAELNQRGAEAQASEAPERVTPDEVLSPVDAK